MVCAISVEILVSLYIAGTWTPGRTIINFTTIAKLSDYYADSHLQTSVVTDRASWHAIIHQEVVLEHMRGLLAPASCLWCVPLPTSMATETVTTGKLTRRLHTPWTWCIEGNFHRIRTITQRSPVPSWENQYPPFEMLSGNKNLRNRIVAYKNWFLLSLGRW